MAKSDAGTSPNTEEKKVKGMTQPEITIIEEKLSRGSGILPVEIAGSLSIRFDKYLDEINTVRSQLAYVETTIPGKTNEVKKQRIEKIADINSKLEEIKGKRQIAISKWHKKVIEYIIETYGKPVIENGVTIGYGDRIEVMKNKHLKKFW